MINTEIDKILSNLVDLNGRDFFVEHRGNSISFPLRCSIQTYELWNQRDIENSLNITLPFELTIIWNKISGFRLFEDITYGQWGLVLWSPHEILKRQSIIISKRKQDFYQGDLIIGEFLGDSDLLLVRCDCREKDFGSIIVALPLYPRNEWFKVELSLTDFLQKFINSSGEKYWE